MAGSTIYNTYNKLRTDARRVASPTEWLYKTGSGAKQGVIAKKALQQPFQQVRILALFLQFDRSSMSCLMHLSNTLSNCLSTRMMCRSHT